jgi:hypothetical protein
VLNSKDTPLARTKLVAIAGRSAWQDSPVHAIILGWTLN